MRYFTFLIFILLALSGCVSKNPPMVEHRLHLQNSQPTSVQSSCSQKDLKVALAFAKSVLMSQKMHYVEDDFKEYAFSDSEWAQSPNRAITQQIFESVRHAKLFKNVLNHNSHSRSDYILESNIEEFMQHFDEDADHSYVVARLSFALINTKSSRVVESLSIEKRLDVEELSAAGGVKGLSLALQELLAEQNLWLQKVCR